MQISWEDQNVDKAARERAEQAMTDFATTNSLTDSDLVRIFRDADEPLFSQIDSLITAIATSGWHNPNGFKGYSIKS